MKNSFVKKISFGTEEFKLRLYFFLNEDGFLFVKYVFPNKKRSIQMVQE